MTLSNTLIRGSNRALDFFLRVNPGYILNDGTPIEKSKDPAGVMMKASKFLLADAVNPDTGLVDYRSLRASDAVRATPTLDSAGSPASSRHTKQAILAMVLP